MNPIVAITIAVAVCAYICTAGRYVPPEDRRQKRRSFRADRSGYDTPEILDEDTATLLNASPPSELKH